MADKDYDQIADDEAWVNDALAGGNQSPQKPREDITLFVGFFGRSLDTLASPDPSNPTQRGPDSHWRLYFDLTFSEYIEFRQGDVVNIESLKTNGSQAGGVALWLSSGANVAYCGVVPAGAVQQLRGASAARQQASFLQGMLSNALMSRASPGGLMGGAAGGFGGPGGSNLLGCGGSNLLGCGGSNLLGCGGSNLLGCGGSGLLGCGM
jgi:hypothetical protein